MLAVRKAHHRSTRFLATAFGSALAFLCLGLFGCRSATPALSGKAVSDALSCRGHATYRQPGKNLRIVLGTTVMRDGGIVPGVSVILSGREPNGDVFRAVSDNRGQFAFGDIRAGTYTLKTCLEGFDTIEMPLTLSRGGSSEPLILTIALST
jgi:Carboxypeptidase regulatory-like domain